MAWCTSPDSDNHKQIYVSVNKQILANIGTGAGSTSGWNTYLFKQVDYRSRLGFGFLNDKSSSVYLLYETYDNLGVATSYYTTNKSFGVGPLTNWSTPVALSPQRAARVLQGHVHQGQAYRFWTG